MLDTSLHDFHELLESANECSRASTPRRVLYAPFCRLLTLMNSHWLTMWGLQAVLQKLRKKQTGSTLDQGQLTQSEHDFPSKAPNVSLTEQAETSFALC